MTFSSSVQEQALVACGRKCCICHKFCGTKMELHHIQLRTEGGDDSIDNCIPLCFDCHADMTSYDYMHPKGKKYTGPELKAHRDAWYRKVSQTPAHLADPETARVDASLYSSITTTLRWNSAAIRLLREHHFGGSFPADAIDPLDEFMHDACNPEFEFLDADLEALRAEFASALSQFLREMSVNVFPTDNRSYLSIPEEWEYRHPDRWSSTVARLNDLSSTAASRYEELIRTARRKLGQALLPE